MTPPDPRLLGPLIAQLRLARGWSQQRLAAELCAASGAPTVTRHEISRWERQARLPGDRWLHRLALVLDAPAGLLVEAAGRSRHRGPVGAGGSRSRSALLALAQRWAADPHAPLLVAPAAVDRDADAGGPGRSEPGGPPAPGELAELRRLDDVSGGADLAPAGAYRLRRAARALAGAGPAERRRLLPVLAETAQFAGWLHADAGDPAAGLDAYRLGLRAAAAAGDPALAGHVLGSASHLLAGAADPEGALLLARTAYAGARRAAGPGLRALLLHRVALAAALGGRTRAARQALDAARRAGGAVEPAAEPPWLYWLDDAELAAMTGRTLVALGRPRPALPLLRAARRAGRPRRAAVYGGWLARGLLQLGEVEQACAVAGAALLDAVRAGSARAATPLAELERRLAAHRGEPAVRRYAALLADARGFLPRGPVTAPVRSSSGRRAGPPGGSGATRRPGGGARPTPTG
ncbi:helix-turn-helix domain-containing protein [Micromonospora sp. URMC 105]|uniref:helix-turn-helix domain-containing protein n=1 Tax=Micromonospora sp. URMC 105 TaxID=3423413 RepID=UPI003F1A3075